LRENLITPENIAKVSQLEPIANDLGCTLAQLGLAWCLKNPNVSTVMTGASKPEQVVENMKALDVVDKLDSAVMERIDDVLGNKPDSDQS
jgi:aryl-alcohol dehydrogenase-like predicted oxidoreductase